MFAPPWAGAAVVLGDGIIEVVVCAVGAAAWSLADGDVFLLPQPTSKATIQTNDWQRVITVTSRRA